MLDIVVLDKIKKIIGTGKFANTKSLIDTDDKLQDDITFTNVTILITCVLKDNGKFYLHIFLDKALLSKHDILQDGGIGACQEIRKEKISMKLGKAKNGFSAQDILGPKIMYENLVSYKNLYKFCSFFLCNFFGPKCSDAPRSFTTTFLVCAKLKEVRECKRPPRFVPFTFVFSIFQ